MITVMGIDGSISHTGIVIIQSKKNSLEFKVKETCVLVPKAKGDDRIIEIMNLIENKLLVHHPDLVASEDTFFGKAGPSMMKYTGTLASTIARGRYNNLFIHNQTLKKFATNSGKSDKEDLIKWASQFNGIYKDIKDKDFEHVADAMSAAFVGYCVLLPDDKDFNDYQKGKIADFRKELLK